MNTSDTSSPYSSSNRGSQEIIYTTGSDDIDSGHSGQRHGIFEADYFVEAERTYNSSSWVYRLPVDQEEVMRQDRQHYVMLSALPGLYRGPVEEILQKEGQKRRLLDIGCGTGIWLQEMAELFPDVDCVGIDITPLQHDAQFRNCTFMQVHAPSGLRFLGEKSFDVIHIRGMLHSTDEYAEILSMAYPLLRPHGILLVHEAQMQLHCAWEGFDIHELSPCHTQMSIHLRAAHQHRGIDTTLFSRMEELLRNVGFQGDTIDTYYHYRQGCHDDPASEQGQNEAASTIAFLYATRLIMLEAGVIDEDQFDQLIVGVSEEVYGRSSGTAGPLGAQGVLTPWGYWWAIKAE
ncbi:uncharacterized protein L201_004080 [Kwoniella dendrophila CBS 6074]|uniref:Methyltransferase domain-containing protein n=1 Tax=Kwoniella dendrophila CBS 6074 TaxID=1295534 RepID=A0AAX4JUT4_9TREE